MKRKHFPDVVFCRHALPYETFSFLMAESKNKKERISIESTNALTQLSKYVRLTAVLSRLYERNIFYGLLFNGQSAIYLKIMLEEDPWKNFKFIYYYSKKYTLRHDSSFNECLLSFIDHSSRSFPYIFQKIAPNHRYITMLKPDEQLHIDVRVYESASAFPSFDYASVAWLDTFPAYVYHSHLSFVYLTEKYAIKASPYGKYRLFVDRECEFYATASTPNGHNILPFHGSFKTPKFTFICLSRAMPIIGGGKNVFFAIFKVSLNT